MTDIVTGNQIDIAAFDSGMSNNDKRKQLRGTRFADWVEDRGRDAVGYLQRASQDQEGWHDDVLRGAGKVLQGAGAVAEAPVIKQGLQLLDAPVHYLAQGAGNVAEKAGVDPRLGQWGVRAAETALTMGGGIAKKTGKLDDLARIAGNRMDELAVAGMNKLPSQNVHAYSNVAEVPSNVRARRVTKKHFGSTEFIDDFSKKTQILEDTFAKQGNLDGVPSDVRKIVAPDGEKYVYKSTSPKGQPGKFSWKADSNIQEVIRSRRNATKLDQQTLKPLFEKLTDEGSAVEKLNQYKKTNHKVVVEVQEAIKNINKGKPKSEWLSLEHIFDVNFYPRTKKDLVSKFSGQGADELDNLKVIPYTMNSQTGALNKKITIDDALIKAVRRGEFTDYDKSVSQFLAYDMGDEIAKFTKNDWKVVTDRILKGEDGVTVQDMLFDYIKKKPTRSLKVRK